MKDKSDEILRTISMTYFYCKIIRNDDGRIKDFIIERSNYLEDELKNKKFTELITTNDEFLISEIMDDWEEIIKSVMKYEELNTGNIEVKKVYYDYITIWCKEKYIDKSLNLEKIIKEPHFYKLNKKLEKLKEARELFNKTRIDKNILNRKDAAFFEVLNNLDDAVVIKHREKTIFVNNAFENLYGISCSEIYKSNSMIVAPESIHPDDRYLFDNINYDEPLEKVSRIIRNDNEIRWVWFRSSPIKDENNNTLRRVIIINDITDKIERENELDRLRMEFFANITHEFKTPVNLISSSLQLMNMKLNGGEFESKDQYIKYIDICNQNVFRMIKLINNLIDSMKIEEGIFRYNPKKQEIVSFVEDICMRVAEFISRYSIDIIFDTEFEEKIAYFDSEHMERILLNLMSNAIKFNKNNSKIEVFLSLKNNMIEIRVKDYGVGISKENLSFIFNRFKRINNRMTKINEGCGIGLYLVKSLVQMHGGDVKINSELGNGTEVTITIPDIIREADSYNLKEETISEELVNKVEHNQLNKLLIEFSDVYI